MAVHVRYNSWYISLPSCAKQQCEMTKFCVVWRAWMMTANCLLIYIPKLTLLCSIFSFEVHVVFTVTNKINDLRVARLVSKKLVHFFKFCCCPLRHHHGFLNSLLTPSTQTPRSYSQDFFLIIDSEKSVEKYCSCLNLTWLNFYSKFHHHQVTKKIIFKISSLFF